MTTDNTDETNTDRIKMGIQSSLSVASVISVVEIQFVHCDPDRMLRFARLMGYVMQTVFKLGIEVCVVLIVVVYPFVAVFRGRPVEETVKYSWGIQILYFIGLCLGIPTIGRFFSRGLEYELATNWVPDAPILVPIAVFGWLNPLIVGSIANFLRKRWLSCRSNKNQLSQSSTE